MLQPHVAYSCKPDDRVKIRLSPGSFYNGKEHIIHCTSKQYKNGMEAYKKGALLQEAFSFLTPGDREFLMSGLTPKEFECAFPDEE